MVKQLNEQAILNELHGGSAFFKSSPTSTDEFTPQRGKKKVEGLPKSKKPNQSSVQHKTTQDQSDNQSTSELTDSSTHRPHSQPNTIPVERATGEVTNPSSNLVVAPLVHQITSQSFDLSSVLPRPKAFYITETQDENLDVLVKKLAERVKGRTEQKIDRSVVTRLLFECNDLASDDTVDRLAKQLTRRLASQLTSPLDDD